MATPLELIAIWMPQPEADLVEKVNRLERLVEGLYLMGKPGPGVTPPSGFVAPSELLVRALAGDVTLSADVTIAGVTAGILLVLRGGLARGAELFIGGEARTRFSDELLASVGARRPDGAHRGALVS